MKVKLEIEIDMATGVYQLKVHPNHILMNEEADLEIYSQLLAKVLQDLHQRQNHTKQPSTALFTESYAKNHSFN